MKETASPKAPRLQRSLDDEFLDLLRKNPAYQHIDSERELAKIDAWLLAHPGRKKTPKFIVGWFNRIEKPTALVNSVKHRATTKEEHEKGW